MNKRIIVLIALVVAVFAAPASAETLEVRGTIAELDAAYPTLGVDRVWDYSEFAGFWYDPDDNLETETLTITADYWGNPTLTFPYDRTLDEGTLVYQTQSVFQEYELHENEADPDRTTATAMENDYLGGRIGLCVDSDNPGGDCGYFIEGWMAEEYVAIDNNADKLCKLLVEFEDDDKKTLSTGEEWDLGGGFALVTNQIDLEGDKVWFSLKKDGRELDNEVISIGEGTARQDRVYTYTADIGNEEDIPVFSCYADAVFRGTDTNVVQVMYVFLIDDDVLEIETSQTYGAMEVMTASSSAVVLKNDATTIDLDEDTTEHIMGNMYFKTADDDCAIRFYPMVEYTEPGTYEVRGTIEELDGDDSTLDEDRVWDYSEFAGFWYDLDDNLETERLTILSGAVAGDTIGPLNYDTNQRTIGEGRLEYTTHPVFQEYELHQDVTVDRDATDEEDDRWADGLLEQHIGLLVESSNPRGDCGYYIEGWMAEEYVAIDGNADELCKLMVEFEDDDKKTLVVGEEWDLGGGFALVANQIDLEGDKVWFSLKKDGRELDNEVASTGSTDKQDRVYTYTADIGNEEDIPVFSCYVDAVFRGTDSNIVQVMYVFLIDDDVLEIDTSDTYGSMEVMTASSDRIVLKNDETTVDLDTDTTEHIMGDMYFKIPVRRAHHRRRTTSSWWRRWRHIPTVHYQRHRRRRRA
jgi:S-layer protein (TIGR01567 family)